MTLSDLEAVVTSHAADALKEMKTTLGDKWKLLTDDQKKSAVRASRRFIELEIQELRGEDVAEDKAFVKATVDEFKLAGTIVIATAFEAAFWKALNKTLKALGAFLAGAGASLIL